MSIDRIKEQAAKADEMIAQFSAGPQPEAAPADPVIEAAPAEAPVETPPPAEPPQPQSSQDDAAKWEQRYRSLAGMIESRDRQIDTLHKLIAGMQSAPQAAPSTEPPKTQGISKSDIDAFGEDLVDMARRAAHEVVAQALAKVEGDLAAIKGQLQGVTQVTQQTAQTSFEARLSQAAPNWRAIDEDPAFITWLQRVPAIAEAFKLAVNNQDVASLAYFFSSYEKETSPAPTPAPQVPAPEPVAKSTVEKMVAPGRARSVVPQVAKVDERKVWTRSEIANTYANKRNYAADEFAKLEREIALAQKENRVNYTK